MTDGPWSTADVRGFAVSLPEATEGSHFDRADFRVHNKIFAALPPDGRTVNLKIDPIALDMLLRDGSKVYRDVWNGRWVGVEMSAVSPAEVERLVVEAYCLVAPKALASVVKPKGGNP
jgi:hypothetical protein